MRVACGHVAAVGYLLTLPTILNAHLNEDLLACPKCSASIDNAVSLGKRQRKSGVVSRFRCRCGHRYTDRLGFSKMRNDPLLVMAGLDLYSAGLSTRRISLHLKTIYGVEASHMAVYRWVRKYVAVVMRYVKTLTPEVGSEWHTDEMVISMNGEKGFLWNTLDHKTRYLLASVLTSGRSEEEAVVAISAAIAQAKKKPDTQVTDGLASYRGGVRNLGIPIHIFSPKFTDPKNNNLIENLHSQLRHKYDGARGLGEGTSAQVSADAFALDHNFIRPKAKIGGTPAKASHVSPNGRNIWMALVNEGSKSSQARRRVSQDRA